ncbi:MAG: hypothetical protein K0B84_02585 [Firmicutes bacterium]|nr:hypothetical protein [Bacillota bacterium]
MKKALLFIVFLLVLGMTLGLTAGCGQDQAVEDTTPPADDAAEDDVDIYDFPENNEAMAQILAIVTELGDRLNERDGYYGDLHDVVVANGNRQGPEHAELYALFNEWIYEVEATYLYSFIDDGGDNNLIIVDGAEPEDMDPYGYEYPKEPWTVDAFATGEPQVAKTTWMDDYGYGLQKSAFAPVYNSDGEISFLLGIDYPVPQLEDYTEIMD